MLIFEMSGNYELLPLSCLPPSSVMGWQIVSSPAQPVLSLFNRWVSGSYTGFSKNRMIGKEMNKRDLPHSHFVDFMGTSFLSLNVNSQGQEAE